MVARAMPHKTRERRVNNCGCVSLLFYSRIPSEPWYTYIIYKVYCVPTYSNEAGMANIWYMMAVAMRL